MNPFRRRSDKAEAIGFGAIAVVAVVFGIITGTWIAWLFAVIAAVRSLLFVRSMRATQTARTDEGPDAGTMP